MTTTATKKKKAKAASKPKTAAAAKTSKEAKRSKAKATVAENAERDANFMEQTAKQDKLDAVTKKVRDTLGNVDESAAELRDTIKLARKTDDSKVAHALVDHAQVLADRITDDIAELIRTAKQMLSKAGGKW